jgi:hypothetical protein
VTAVAEPTSRDATRAGLTWHGVAFGIDLRSAEPIGGVQPLVAPARAPAVTTLELIKGHELKARCRSAQRSTLVDRRHRDGRLMMSVDRYEGLGYRIAAPRHGRHLVSLDGRSIESVIPDTPAWKWQRLLFAQVLPLASTLQGLELLHASGVVIGERAFGFVAPSGTGKTTLAMHLVARGAQLLTDDVLAVETGAHGILAHPGGGLANIHSNEFEALDGHARARLGEVIGRSDKVHIAARLAAAPAPLAAIYFLRRKASDGEGVTIETEASLSPHFLLTGRFISYLSTARHLTAHLDAAARITASVPRFLVNIPVGGPSAEVADAVGAHIARNLDAAR